jgi:2-methylcitrate dehydratase
MDRILNDLRTYSCRLRYNDLDPETIHQVKRVVIDTLGCAIGGYLSEPGEIARRLAGGVTSSTPSRILGSGQKSTLDLAGFANGVMVRFLDCNDSYFTPSGGHAGHPSDMIPAALAMVDCLERDGKTLITAIVLAYEVFSRLYDQVLASDFGWDNGIFNVIGAACGAGKAMGLKEEQMGHAISLAITPNLPLGATRAGELSMWKGCAVACSTRSALFAVQLASEGMTGPAEPFEGRKGLWKQLGVTEDVRLELLGGNAEAFRINDNTFKSYPSQIHTQAPIGLALELRPKVDLSQIEYIRIKIYKAGVRSAASEQKWDPKTRETADHSIPFLVAAALTDGAINLDTFRMERIADPALRTLIKKMKVEEDPEFTRRYPMEYNCHIEIKDQSGQTVTAAASYPKGHRKNPLSDSEIAAKFFSLAVPNISEQQAQRVLDLIWSLEDLPNLDQVFDSVKI